MNKVIGWALAGLGVAVIGGIIWHEESKPAPATVPPGTAGATGPTATNPTGTATGSAPAPLPPYANLITDTPTITAAQTDVATWAAGQPSLPPIFGGSTWTTADIASAKLAAGGPGKYPPWVAFLTTLQNWFNSTNAGANIGGGFPAKIRNDGVLDGQTYLLIQHL
jgi:hypothetical protein